MQLAIIAVKSYYNQSFTNCFMAGSILLVVHAYCAPNVYRYTYCIGHMTCTCRWYSSIIHLNHTYMYIKNQVLEKVLLIVNLTIAILHRLHIVVRIFEANKTISFCLFRPFISDYFSLLERRIS